MPLEPYQQYQPSTPEATPSPRLDCRGHGRNSSGSSTWTSPDSLHSAATHLTTPNASPQKSNAYNILPKIRTQDQSFEPDYYGPSVHRRARSHDVDAQNLSLSYRPADQRSTTSPPEFSTKTIPLSDTSSLSPWVDSAAESPLISLNGKHQSHGHGRSISTSCIDPSTIHPVVNPYYRTMPEYVTYESALCAPAMFSNSTYQSTSYQTPDIFNPYSQELPAALTFGKDDDFYAVTTINTYLSEPNPALNLVPESARLGNGKVKHFWWDVRNLRTWKDFGFEIISSLPGLPHLTNADIKLAALPSPARLGSSATNPQDLSTLAHTIDHCYIAKVNAALRASTRGAYINMSLKTTAEDGCYFVSNLANEREGTLGSRGKVVGLVKPYERWNSGKRTEPGQKRVEYLQHLAHLQVLMRQHNCRYGFMISEIELVCVRLGTNPVPNFGYLELCKPIRMSTCRANMDASRGNMTACLALWYLNILARDGENCGQPGARIDVGPPEAHTRSRVLSKGIEGRDAWMPKAQIYETRQAKSLRGWIWPEDPVHRQKEGVGSARTKRR